MYFHLPYSPEFFVVAPGRKSAGKVFRQATELMVVIDHEFGANPTSPSFAFPSCLFDMRI